VNDGSGTRRGSARRLRAAAVAGCAVLATAASGCGGGGDEKPQAAGDAAAAVVSGAETTAVTAPDEAAAETTETAAASSEAKTAKKAGKAEKPTQKPAAESEHAAAASGSSPSSAVKKSSGKRTRTAAKKRGKRRSSAKRSPSGEGGGSATAATPSTPAGPSFGPQPTGSFAYDSSGSLKGGGATANVPSTTTLEISSVGDGVQRQVRDLRDANGNGAYTSSVLAYDGAGVHLRTLELRGKLAGVSDQRTLSGSDPLFLSSDPKPGEGHDFTLSGSNVTAQVHVEVTGTGSVAGVATTEVRVRVEYSGQVQGTTDQQLALSRGGFPVRESATTDLQFKVGSSHSEYTVTARQVPGG
jgi:hypothetical protein